MPDALLEFKPLATDERVLAAITGGGLDSDVPSIHKVAVAYAKTGDRGEELRNRVAALERAYNQAATDTLATKGWFRRSHNAIVAGNNAFREVYDQVWHGFIESGEKAGVQRYHRAVAQLQKRCDKTVTKQRATDVLTLYQDAAHVQPMFKASMTALVQQCRQFAEKEARLRYLDHLRQTSNTRTLRQQLKMYFDSADIDKDGKLSRSELLRCILEATRDLSGGSISTNTRNRRMTGGKSGAEERQQDTTVVCDLEVDKSWKRDPLCAQQKKRHLESLSRVYESREQWVLDTVLCGNRYALQQNMFPFALPHDEHEGATEHWVFWSVSADTPPREEFRAFVSVQLQAVHATTGCSWGYRQFENRDSIPGLFHAHVFCRPLATWLPEEQQLARDKAVAARQVDETDLQSATGPIVVKATGKTAPVSMPAPDSIVVRALFPGSSSLSCESLAGGNSTARVYAVMADVGTRIRAVVKVGTARQMVKEAQQLNIVRRMLGAMAVPAVLQDPVQAQLTDGSTCAGLACEMVLQVESSAAHPVPDIAPSVSFLLQQVMVASTSKAPLRVHAALRDVFGPGGLLRSLAERTIRRADAPGPVGALIARKGQGHAANMAGPRFVRDRIQAHLKRGDFQTTHLALFRQACLLAPINNATGVTERGLQEVTQNLQWLLRQHGHEKEASSLEKVVFVRRDEDKAPVAAGGGSGADPASLRFLTCTTHGDLNPRNLLSRGGDALPCLVDVARFGPGRYVLTDVARLMFLILHETPIDTADELAEARCLSDQLFGEHTRAVKDLHELPHVDLDALSSSRLRVAATCVLQLWQYCGPLVARCGGSTEDLHPFGLLLALHGTASSRLLYVGAPLLSPLQQEWALHTASVLATRLSGLLIQGLDLPSGLGNIDAPTRTVLPPVALADVDAIMAALPFNEDGYLNYEEFMASPAAINLLVNAMASAECDRALHDEDYEGNERTELFDFVLTLAPGLKKIPRIIEKAALRFGDDAGDVSCVKDVVRAMVVVQRMDQVAVVVEQLRQRHDIVVVRLKERFLQAPSAGGWRDLMVSFYLRADAQRQHICELQVVHEMMLQARKGLPGHVVYGRVRNAMELLEWNRGSGAAADTLALADLLDATGPGRVIGVEGAKLSHTTFTTNGTDSHYPRHATHQSGKQIRLEDKNWLGDDPVGEWQNVVASADGRVTELHLRGMDLRGDLPPSLDALGQLEVLDIRENPKLCLDGVPIQDCAEVLALPMTPLGDQLKGEALFNTKETCRAVLEVVGHDQNWRAAVKREWELAKKHGCADVLALWALKEEGMTMSWPNGRWFETEEADSASWKGITLAQGSDGDSGNHKRVVVSIVVECEMSTVAGEIGDLSSLHTLDLRRCSRLKTLPDRIGDLSSLHTLNLNCCYNLTALPDRIGDLSSLHTLDLNFCKSLTALPDRIGDLSSLHTLNLSSCNSLTALPNRIGDLSSLVGDSLKTKIGEWDVGFDIGCT